MKYTYLYEEIINTSKGILGHIIILSMGVTRGGQGGAPAPPWNLNFPLYVLVLA